MCLLLVKEPCYKLLSLHDFQHIHQAPVYVCTCAWWQDAILKWLLMINGFIEGAGMNELCCLMQCLIVAALIAEPHSQALVIAMFTSGADEQLLGATSPPASHCGHNGVL